MTNQEQSALRKSIDDYNRFKDEPQGMHCGLWQDAKNSWQSGYASATSLNSQEDVLAAPPLLAEYFLKKIHTKLPTYRAYLEQRYSPEAVEAIVHHPGSNPEKIAQNDALVVEYNELIGREKFSPQQAFDICSRALALFDK